MAEFLLRTQDNTDDDIHVNIKSWKRGMVITVQEDGWNWGVEERTNPIFQIIKVPGMSVAAGSVFLGNLTDPNFEGRDSNPLRAFKINLDSLALNTSTSTTATIPTGDVVDTPVDTSLTMTNDDLIALKTEVVIDNPLILG